jgi:phosphoribosylanthranilate isomerase
MAAMSSRVRIKICGISSVADAEQAVGLGADAIGLNFHPRSPRHVAYEKAKEIILAVPPLVEIVGVYVGTLLELVAHARHVPMIRTVQRHAASHEVGMLPEGYRLIEAFQVPGRHSLADITRYVEDATREDRPPAALLIDGSTPGQFGGTGHPAPWKELADFDPGVPLILAGGLTPDNVAEAIRTVHPYAVDVASGVEAAPGRKDIEKMKRFIDNARSA